MFHSNHGNGSAFNLDYGVMYNKNIFYEYIGFEIPTAVVMKSSIFWDITPRSPLKVNRRFGGTYPLLSRWFLARRILRHVPPERRLTSNGPHGVISQKIELLKNSFSSHGNASHNKTIK
jgi:hypothetical protein